jgi:hypothetical protein
MVPIDAALRELSFFSEQLNRETEVLNSLILDLEQRLAAAQIGVSVWLSESLLAENENGTSSTGWLLGYGKLSEAWRILAKPVTRTWVPVYDDPGEYSSRTEDRGAIVALANAPRIVRVEAAEHLEPLVNQIAEKVKGFIANIEKAKMFAGTEDASDDTEDASDDTL